MKFSLSIFLFLFLWIHCKGQTVTANVGTWTNNLSANMISTAGSDYSQNSITSNTNQTLLDVIPSSSIVNNPTRSWVVKIHKEDDKWDNSLELYAKRTNPSTLTISGGTVYNNPISIMSSPFFSGFFSHTSIPIQYEIRGLSVLIPAGNYSTTVYYTISDN